MKHFVTICTFIILTSGMVFAQGAGNALDFDGGDYVDCTNNSSLKPSDVLTIEAWVRPDDDVHAGGGAGAIISDGNESNIGVNLGLQANQVSQCDILTNNGVKSVTGSALTVDPLTWTHLAFVFNGTSLIIYKNGVSDNSISFAASSITTNTNNLIIGGRPTDSDRRFLGDIDEVRIWHAVLSGTTINSWKGIPLSASHPDWENLVSYYKFDEDNVGSTSGNCVDSKGSNTAYNYDALWFVNSDLPLPVELAMFTAKSTIDGNSIELHWVTASEMDNLGFEIVRRENKGEPWQVIASYQTHIELKGQGTVSHETSYHFIDTNVEKNKTYQYSIVNVDVNGTREYSQLAEIALFNKLINKFKLNPAYPNPFNPSTVISYDIKDGCKVTLRVIDVHGRTVRTIINGLTQNSGLYSVEWDGLSDSGSRISSGVYFIVMEAGQFSGSQKVLFLK